MPAPTRRLVILAEGQFGEVSSKTALGVIRYGPDSVVAVLDSTRAGRNVREWLGKGYDIPVVATLEEALSSRPDALLIGIAPAGGRLPSAWRRTVRDAIEAGLDVISGLHAFLGDDPEFAAASAARGVALIDHRRPPDDLEVAMGREHEPGKHVLLTVATDCALGKMSVALELRRAALGAGLRASFVATGQTGMMIEGWGAAIDRIPGDFMQGTVEQLVARGESEADWVFVEGQGSLDHPAYSSVTLALIHGARPDALVMVHQPGRHHHHGWEAQGSRLKPLVPFIALHEAVAALVAPSRVLAVALNTSRLDDDAARAEIRRVSQETGLFCDDPVRFGPAPMLRALVDCLGEAAD